jgi:hypothetical protein
MPDVATLPGPDFCFIFLTVTMKRYDEAEILSS